MTQIVLPDAALTQLATVEKPVSIVDSSGRTLGTFVPGVAYDPELYRRNPSPLTPDERERRRKMGGGMTLSEFWDHMRKTHPDEFKWSTRLSGGPTQLMSSLTYG